MIVRLVLSQKTSKGVGPFDSHAEYTIDCSRIKLRKHFAKPFQTCYVTAQQLRSDIKKSGQSRQTILTNKYFPSDWKIRVGEFGECTAALLMKHRTGARLPLLRLRLKEHPNFPMRGTDVICYRLEKTRTDDALFFAEIKARTTSDKNVVKECYEGLAGDFSYRLATSLLFQERVLRLSKQTKKADILARFANPHKFGSFKKNGQAIVIADADTWEPDAITKMSAEKRRIRYKVEFVCVKTKSLSKAVDIGYEEAANI